MPHAVGCGEGRVSRDLQAMGHRVLAVDLSLAMCRAAASHPAAPVPAVVADATCLPLAIGAADCAVAFMSRHDIDHMPAAIREIARILTGGGHLVIAIVHPINSAGAFTGDKADAGRPFIIDGSYLESRCYVDTVTRDGLTVTFHSEHRPPGGLHRGPYRRRLRHRAAARTHRPRSRQTLAPRPAVPQHPGRTPATCTPLTGG
jgi:SAM-dependent methyltransferase